MDIEAHWDEVRTLFKQSFRSSLHCAVASVAEDGSPHVTPIGSVILGKPGRGIYFEKFPSQLPKNIGVNDRVCILAVNSSRGFWLKSLLRGRFADPPAVRLHGTIGELREPTATEVELWRKRVKRVRFTKGHAMMFAKMSLVRDIRFTEIEPVRVGKMTRDNWQDSGAKE